MILEHKRNGFDKTLSRKSSLTLMSHYQKENYVSEAMMYTLQQFKLT
jgi:hypothetical protein